jgi:predicted dehydrogenase
MNINRRNFLTAASTATLAAQARRSSAASKKYKACVIGDTDAGGYGHNLHMVWAGREDVEVVGLADPHEEARLARAKQCNAQRTYADYREMLEREQPDLVAIGPRWTTRHKEYLVACVEAGAHGIIEKPVATDLAECDAMVAAAEKHGCKWTVAFNFRASPLYAHARRLILEEEIVGEILEVRARGKEDERAGGEDLVVLGIHVFDLMIDLLGKPQWCFADIQMEGRPAAKLDVREAHEPLGPILGDRLDAVFGFPGGVYGRFASAKNRDGNGGRWGVDVCGSKGVVAIRMDTLDRMHLFPNPPWAPMTRPVQWELLPRLEEVAQTHAQVGRYDPIIDDLIAAIEEGREPIASLREGREAQQMVQAVNASHVAGGRVPLPLQQRVHPLKTWA